MLFPGDLEMIVLAFLSDPAAPSLFNKEAMQRQNTFPEAGYTWLSKNVRLIPWHVHREGFLQTPRVLLGCHLRKDFFPPLPSNAGWGVNPRPGAHQACALALSDSPPKHPFLLLYPGRTAGSSPSG